MALKQLFDAFQEELTRIVRKTSETLPTIAFSANALSNQNSFPRVTMVPTTGSIGMSVGQAGFGDSVGQPRSLWARTVRLEMHIWGEDFDECETLMNQVADVLHTLAWGGDRAVTEDWTKNQSSSAKSGVLVVLGTSVEIPLTREPETLQTVDDFVPMDTQFVSQ